MTTKILVIDDDPLVRRSFEQFLTDVGYEVALAANGRAGLALFTKLHPDIVVTDIIMPEQEGIETIIQMRKLNPKAKIIAVSGSGRVSNQDFLSIAAKFGAAATLMKPIDQDQLVDAVRKLLDG